MVFLFYLNLFTHHMFPPHIFLRSSWSFSDLLFSWDDREVRGTIGLSPFLAGVDQHCGEAPGGPHPEGAKTPRGRAILHLPWLARRGARWNWVQEGVSGWCAGARVLDAEGLGNDEALWDVCWLGLRC